MSVTKITTHIDDAKKRLLYRFQQKPKVEALVEGDAKQIQDLEDAAFDFYTKVPLQTATGATLDRWGVVLDELRQGMNDADYRATLFFKIRKNISNGTPEELITILQDLMQGESVQYFEDWPAGVHLTVTNAQNPADPDLILSQLQQLAPAGVIINYIAAGYVSNPFAFAGHPNPNARGFDTTPVEEIGGIFVTLL